MTLRSKLLVSVSVPTSLALALLYLATVARNEGDGKWLFRLGITFAILAFVCGRLTWFAHRQHALEDRVDDLAKSNQELRSQLKLTREDVDSKIATAAWRSAFGNLAQRNGQRHLFLAPLDD